MIKEKKKEAKDLYKLNVKLRKEYKRAYDTKDKKLMETLAKLIEEIDKQLQDKE